jgi:type II secretory pathway pseudopilin PulG
VPFPRPARVVTILSLLVVIAMGGLLLPRYRATERLLRERALAADLDHLNDALQRYTKEHGGTMPGMQDGFVDHDLMLRQLTLPSTTDGAIAPNGPCGPYLAAGVPPNPWNDSAEIKVVTATTLPPPDGTTGWILHVPSGRILSNAREEER